VILYVVAKGGEAVVNQGSGDNPAAALLAGQGVVVFYGMAKPVRTPLIVPARQP
jgi:hypothetical protein